MSSYRCSFKLRVADENDNTGNPKNCTIRESNPTWVEFSRYTLPPIYTEDAHDGFSLVALRNVTAGSLAGLAGESLPIA